MSSTFAIDVMPLLYRGHFAFVNKPRMTSAGVNTSALFSFATTVLQILEQRKPDRLALVFDSNGKTFRHEAYPQYKAQRDKLPEDIAAAIGMAAEFAEAMRIPTVRVDGFEADDVMGAISRLAAAEGDEVYLVSPDKDIAQLVGPGVFLYRLAGHTPETLGAAEVCERWGLKSPRQIIDWLALAGDASDNIPGVRGIGEKTAQKLLSEFDDAESVVAAAAAGKVPGKLGEKLAAGAEDAKMSKFLATIRCDTPLGISVRDLDVKGPDLAAVAAFCAKYELASIAAKLGAAQPGELPLFGAPGDGQAPAGPDGQPAPLATLATTPHDYTLVDDERALAELAAELAAAPRFAFDTEATSQDASTATLVGISFATRPGRAWFVPFGADVPPPADELNLFAPAPSGDGRTAFGQSGHPDQPTHPALPAGTLVAALAPVFAGPAEKIAHNSKYDIELLARHGMPVAAPVHDTMLMHFALDAADRHGLDRLARALLAYDPIPISSLIGEGRAADPMKLAAADPADLLDYAAEDADVALRLYDVLLPEVRKAGAEKALAESEEPLVPILVDMERTGVRVDALALHAFGAELGEELARLERGIWDAAGMEFNLNSPRQLGEVLFERLRIDEKASRTSSGQYATSEDVLLKYAPHSQIVKDILSWRTAEKLRSTYADKLPKCIDPADGRVHTHFSQAFTETGRLASSDPNLQNIPVRTDLGKRIRAAFVARDDNHVLLSADYSQIELRIMAALSGDEAMTAAFLGGRDIHAETASKIFGVPIDEVTPQQRSRCKAVNFGIIYGISTFGLAQRLEISRTEAGQFIADYFRHYPGVKAYMEKAVADAREKGYAETVLHRRRSLRDIASRNATLRQAAERNAINTPVQGSAADLIKLAMVGVDRALRAGGFRAKMVLQIHDELLLDVPKDEEPQVREAVRAAMLGAYDFGVPLVVEIGSGRTWLDAH